MKWMFTKHCGNNFMMYVSQVITLYPLNLLHLNKTERKRTKRNSKFKIYILLILIKTNFDLHSCQNNAKSWLWCH